VNFRVLSAAQTEMTQSALWYDDRQFGLADDFIEEVQTAFRKIAENPESCPLLEHYSGAHQIRRFLLKRFPFVVIYLTRPDEVTIVAIAHGRRHPKYWMSRIP